MNHGHFRVFLEMGPGRSIDAASEGMTIAHGTAMNLSARYDWYSRARAYDQAMNRARDAAVMQEFHDVGVRHGQELVAYQGALSSWAVGMMQRMRDRPNELLALPLDEAMRILVQGAHALPKLIELERVVRGQPSEIVQHDHDHRIGVQPQTAELVRALLSDASHTASAADLLTGLPRVGPDESGGTGDPHGSESVADGGASGPTESGTT